MNTLFVLAALSSYLSLSSPSSPSAPSSPPSVATVVSSADPAIATGPCGSHAQKTASADTSAAHARCLIDADDPQRALDVVAEARAADRWSAALGVWEGAALLRVGLLDAAARAWVQVLEELGTSHDETSGAVRSAAPPDELTAVATEIVRAAASEGHEEAALPALEIAALLAPDEARVWSALARVQRGRAPRAASASAARAARLTLESASDSVELAREAGAARSALRENARVPDSKARLRQRLAILVDMGAWDRARALEPRLRAAELVHGPVAYALAYANFQVGDDAAASALLDAVDDNATFEQAAALRAAIATCAAAPEDTPCAR